MTNKEKLLLGEPFTVKPGGAFFYLKMPDSLVLDLITHDQIGRIISVGDTAFTTENVEHNFYKCHFYEDINFIFDLNSNPHE